MFENENSSNYEGIFAPRPDRIEEGLWTNVEIHHQPLGSDIRIERDWYGNAKVERGWFDF